MCCFVSSMPILIATGTIGTQKQQWFEKFSMPDDFLILQEWSSV
jgi:hypothetical protein